MVWTETAVVGYAGELVDVAGSCSVLGIVHAVGAPGDAHPMPMMTTAQRYAVDTFSSLRGH